MVVCVPFFYTGRSEVFSKGVKFHLVLQFIRKLDEHGVLLFGNEGYLRGLFLYLLSNAFDYD